MKTHQGKRKMLDYVVKTSLIPSIAEDLSNIEEMKRALSTPS